MKASAALGLMLYGVVNIALADEVTPLHFVQQYMRQTAELEQIRAVAETERGKGNNFADCIRNTTKFSLALQSDINWLQSTKLLVQNKELVGTPADLARVYAMKQQNYQTLNDGCSLMLVGPQPGVDYGPFAVEAPKISARLEYLDRMLFETLSPLIFMTLISDQPDSKNRMNHLTISRTEKLALIVSIETQFGAKLNVENRSFGVSAARLFRNKLRDFKGADEPR